MNFKSYHLSINDFLILLLAFCQYINSGFPLNQLIILVILAGVTVLINIIQVIYQSPVHFIQILKAIQTLFLSFQLVLQYSPTLLLMEIQIIQTKTEIQRDKYLFDYFQTKILLIFLVIFFNFYHEDAYFDAVSNIIATIVAMITEVVYILLLIQNSQNSHIKLNDKPLKEKDTPHQGKFFNQQSFTPELDLQKRLSVSTPQLKQHPQPVIEQQANGSQSDMFAPQQQQSLQEKMSLVEQDGNIMQRVSWLQSLMSLVFSDDLTIVYQNFFLGQYVKPGVKLNDEDYQKLFLETHVVYGNKPLINILEPDDDMSIHHVLTQTQQRIRQQLQMREFFETLIEQYDRYTHSSPILSSKNSLFYIYKMENHALELSWLTARVFVQDINAKIHVCVFFEHAKDKPVQEKPPLEDEDAISNLFYTFLQESIGFINTCMTVTTLSLFDQELKQQHVQTYLEPIRYNAIKHKIFLSNMQDHNLFLQNQLFLKITMFRFQDLIEEISLMYQDSCQDRQIVFQQIIEVQESVIYSDQERIKQVLGFLISYTLRYSVKQTILFEVHEFNASTLVVKMMGFDFDEQQYAQTFKTIAQISRKLKLNSNQIRNLDLSSNLELQIVSVLAFQLSGSNKRGLDFSISENKGNFTLLIESSTQQDSQNQSGVKMVGQKRYFETSLSMLLAQQQEDESKFSLSQFSKQFSIRRSETPLDLQSAYFSQISKVKQDTFFNQSSKLLANQLSILQQIQQDSLSQSQKIFARKSSQKMDQQSVDSLQLDFGTDLHQTAKPPDLNPKLLSNVIKFRLQNTCCTKVLLVDNDGYSLMVLDMFLTKYNVTSDKAFNGAMAIHMINNKLPCNRCGNKSYIAYFIEINLPVPLFLINIIVSQWSRTHLPTQEHDEVLRHRPRLCNRQHRVHQPQYKARVIPQWNGLLHQQAIRLF